MPESEIQIVLLCGGKGTRLEGMDLPKPLCTIRGRPLLYHVLEGLPKDIRDVTIFYSEALSRVQFERVVRHSCHSLQALRFQTIPLETRGPVETALVGLHRCPLQMDKPVLFIDNDTVNTFSLSNIDREYPSIGVYQTSDTTKPYSFLKVDASGKRVLSIKEKEGISNTYSTGLYYFPSVALFRRLSMRLFQAQATRTEYFLSDMYALAIDEGLEVRTFPCSATIGLGTHADILENMHKVKFHPMRVCFDIDNTILTYSESVGSSEGVEPIPEMVEILQKLHKEGHTIVLHTARGMKSGGSNLGRVGKKSMMNVFNALERFKIPYDEIYFGKPWADLYVDDKAWNPYSNTSFSSFLFHHLPDTSMLRLEKGCSNNENSLYRREGWLVKEGPTSSLEGEIYFYKMIQGTQLESVCPRYLGSTVAAGRSFLQMDYLDGPSVSKIFRNGLMTKSILAAAVQSIQAFHATAPFEGDGDVTREDILSNYLGKLNERVQSHPNYGLPRIHEMCKILNTIIPEYVQSDKCLLVNAIHGDPWFDNMIYDRKSQSVKLLDMKGKIGSVFTMKGDAMVDYAKLYQSILGFDYFLHGERYPAEYEEQCRAWLEELLPFPLKDPAFEAITACCIVKTFFYFSKTEPVLPIYRSLGKMNLFSSLLNCE
jgi:capsule biosynthesis phosphatase